MSILAVVPPFENFRASDGEPLEAGYIYIGQKGFEARTTPKASFFDIGLTIPTGTASGAAIRTMGGFPVRNGSPSRFYVDGEYSITVTDRNGVVMYSELDAATLVESLIASVNIISVADATALAALDVAQYRAAITADGLQWVFSAADASTEITFGDPRYIAPATDATGASGAWVRAGSVNDNWQPGEWGTSDISIYNGAFAAQWTRTGGIGTIGLNFANLKVTAATPFPQFDVAVTGFASHTNVTGGAWYGGWFAAVSPALSLGHTYSAGFGNGIEVNIGPRSNVVPALADDLGSTFDLVGVRIVPDVATNGDEGPAYEAIASIAIATPGVWGRTAHGYRNGLPMRVFARTGTLPGGFTEGGLYYAVSITADTFQLSATYGGTGIAATGSFAAGVAVVPSYAASFGLAVGKSDDRNEFWTGFLCSADTIVAGGIIARLRGGSVLAHAPGNGILVDGFVTNAINLSGTMTNGFVASGTATNGINLSTATISNAAILLGANHGIKWSAADISSNGANITLTTTTGGATLPRLTTTQRDAVGAWADGTVIYNTTVPQFQGRVSGAWVAL